MGPSDIAFLVFPIFFIGMWLLVTSILRSVSGMTTSLPTAPVQALRSSRWGSAAINGVNFGNTVKIQEHSDGYVVRAMRLFGGGVLWLPKAGLRVGPMRPRKLLFPRSCVLISELNQVILYGSLADFVLRADDSTHPV